jgi:hypothetical protein
MKSQRADANTNRRLMRALLYTKALALPQRTEQLAEGSASVGANPPPGSWGCTARSSFVCGGVYKKPLWPAVAVAVAVAAVYELKKAPPCPRPPGTSCLLPIAAY